MLEMHPKQMIVVAVNFLKMNCTAWPSRKIFINFNCKLSTGTIYCSSWPRDCQWAGDTNLNFLWRRTVFKTPRLMLIILASGSSSMERDIKFDTVNSMCSHGKQYWYCIYLFFFVVQKKASNGDRIYWVIVTKVSFSFHELIWKKEWKEWVKTSTLHVKMMPYLQSALGQTQIRCRWIQHSTVPLYQTLSNSTGPTLPPLLPPMQ